jgi:hypothetical protein
MSDLLFIRMSSVGFLVELNMEHDIESSNSIIKLKEGRLYFHCKSRDKEYVLCYSCWII